MLSKTSANAVHVLAMAEKMLAYARGQLKTSIENAAYVLKSSEELSASELLIVEDFDAHSLSAAQKELLHHMQGGYSVDSREDRTKEEGFEQCTKALRESRKCTPSGPVGQLRANP